MTKVFKLCLVPVIASVLLWCLSAQVYAEETTVEGATELITGYCGVTTESDSLGKNLTYTISDSNTKLTISGSGAMADYTYTSSNSTNSPFYTYKDTLTTLVFEEREDGITHIGSYAFAYCKGLTGSLTVPNSVTSIGNSAFRDCSGLTGSLTIPNSVTSVDNFAFLGCSGLTGVVIPSSVTSVGSGILETCASLTNITISYGITTISDYMFAGCTSLTDITIPSSVTKIDENAFDGCDSLESIIIPGSVITIGDGAFVCCTKLKKVTILSGVTTIGCSVFEQCESLTDVTLPDSLTTISDYGFQDCSSLTNITIPDSVTTIGSYAFIYCTSLTSITIPSSVTSVGSDVFKDCTALTSIDLSTNDISIANTLLSSYGDAVQISEMTVLNQTDAIDEATLAKIKRLRCFKGSTADSYTLSDTQEKVHIQHQKAFNVRITKPKNGEWIQRVDVVIKKGEEEKIIKLNYYSYDEESGTGTYIFPVLMYADSYLGDEPDLTYNVRYFYNYSSEAMSDEDILKEPWEPYYDNESNRLSNPKQIYYQKVSLESTPFTIQEVD